MAEELPLTSLLSQVLIALTIEADNEFERRVPHFISDDKSKPWMGVWLISHAMYAHFLRFVEDDGIAMGDLAVAAGYGPPVHPAYHGMRRWGYVTYTPDIAGASPKKTDAAAVVRCTPNGRQARDAWSDVLAEMQDRWNERGLAALHAALIPIVESIERPLPEYMPNVGFDRRTPDLDQPRTRPPLELGLLALLSQCLLAMTYDFEERSELALGTYAGLLGPLTDEPTLVRDLYETTGVARKEWGSAMTQLAKAGLAVVGPVPGGKAKAIWLSSEGIAAKERARSLLREVEAKWRKQCGISLEKLRSELERVVADAWNWTDPYPDGWRSKTKLPRHLAH
ncbi:MAG: hypothetical protein QOI61_231, partial [Actinomycetota bacterium]